MQRDIGNEIIVAIVAVGVLAFALTFGIILSLSNPQPEATEEVVLEVTTEVSPTPVASDTDEPTAAPTATEEPPATDTAAPTNTLTVTQTPTLTETATATPTATREPTERVSALSTDTDIPSPTRTPTHTPTASDTNTPRPTRTPTLTPTASDTNTPRPTQTPTLTPTTSDTNTPRPTQTPALTPTTSDTNTPRPTQTPAPTRQPTNTPTATVSSTPTPRIVPTVTPLVTATGNSPTPEHVSENICIAPFGWIEYVIRPGDNLFSLARATGTTVSEMRDANCLDNIDRINVGTHLYIPGPVARQYANANITEPEAQGCTDPDSVILRPLPGESVQGVFSLMGTASDDDFAYYRLELRANDADEYTLYSRHDRRVLRDVLGIIDSDLFSPGLYWVRLSVHNNDGEIALPPCAIPVIFE